MEINLDNALSDLFNQNNMDSFTKTNRDRKVRSLESQIENKVVDLIFNTCFSLINI